MYVASTSSMVSLPVWFGIHHSNIHRHIQTVSFQLTTATLIKFNTLNAKCIYIYTCLQNENYLPDHSCSTACVFYVLIKITLNKHASANMHASAILICM